MKFNIIIRGRNCAKYIPACLRSIAMQKHKDWHAHVSLDAPTDTSVDVATTAISKMHMGEKTTMTVRSRHYGLSRNLWHTLKNCKAKDDDVIAIVDADDFIHKGSLRYINKLYEKKPDLLLTYGSYIKMSKGRRTRISRKYKEKAYVRKAKWHASHLKTFKYKLFKHLAADFLKDDKGEWLPAASDVALMIPLIELAGLDRTRWVDKLLYYWRDNTPYKTSRETQIKCEKIIRAKKPLQRIEL